jgi:hypothetical protein
MRKGIFAVSLVILLMPDAGSGQSRADARAGDIANGVVVQEQVGVSLILNTTPCSAQPQSQYLVFHDPYRRRDLGQSSCPSGGNYARVSVEQQ